MQTELEEDLEDWAVDCLPDNGLPLVLVSMVIVTLPGKLTSGSLAPHSLVARSKLMIVHSSTYPAHSKQINRCITDIGIQALEAKACDI